MKIIIGLGNPGIEYEKTRHNVGFMVLEELRRKLDFPEFQLSKQLDSDISEEEYKGEKVLLVKPLTFMNNSGIAVSKLLNYYKVDLKNCWIIYDDIDLLLGTVRMRDKGSAGTHNGMKSIISVIGSGNFPRFRVGIESRGVTAPKEQEIVSFVLSKFTKEENDILEKSIMETIRLLISSLSEN